MASEAALRRPAPVENLTLWQRVHDHLRDEILSGRLKPGAELAEVALSEQLGVSRGPLREAIGRLASEGLVTVRPRRGAVVRSLSKDEFLGLYQVREALEMLAVRLAVPRLGAEDVARARRDCVERMAAHAERDEVEEFFEANSAFHVRLVEAAGNAKLLELYEQLLAQLDRYRLRSLTPAREPRPLRRRARRDPPCGEARGCRPRRAPHVRAHPRAAAQPQGLERRRVRRRGAEVIEFGVNLNNREPLIAPDYDLPMLLDLSEIVEESGFDSVWVGDSALLEAALRADLAALGDLAADVACPARHLVHGLLDAQPALPRARVGDARRDLGRPDDPRHRDGQPRGGRPARVRGARARLRASAARCSRRGSRSCGSCGPRARRTSTARSFDYDDVSFYSGHRDGRR